MRYSPRILRNHFTVNHNHGCIKTVIPLPLTIRRYFSINSSTLRRRRSGRSSRSRSSRSRPNLIKRIHQIIKVFTSKRSTKLLIQTSLNSTTLRLRSRSANTVNNTSPRINSSNSISSTISINTIQNKLARTISISKTTYLKIPRL